MVLFTSGHFYKDFSAAKNEIYIYGIIHMKFSNNKKIKAQFPYLLMPFPWFNQQKLFSLSLASVIHAEAPRSGTVNAGNERYVERATLHGYKSS